jgi:stage V sporulation protein R
MTGKVATAVDIIDFADRHAGTMGVQPGAINPYKLGLELFRDIEYRWDTGRFGRDFDECDDAETKRTWDKQLGEGRAKIFQTRRIHNDLTFVDEFLTPEFAEAQKLFVYQHNPYTNQYEIADRDPTRIKRELIKSLTNCGQPIIAVADGNFGNRGELLLVHDHRGTDLDDQKASDTLENVQKLWGRPVLIATIFEDEAKLLRYDGKEHASKDLPEGDIWDILKSLKK